MAMASVCPRYRAGMPRSWCPLHRASWSGRRGHCGCHARFHVDVGRRLTLNEASDHRCWPDSVRSVLGVRKHLSDVLVAYRLAITGCAADACVVNPMIKNGWIDGAVRQCSRNDLPG